MAARRFLSGVDLSPGSALSAHVGATYSNANNSAVIEGRYNSSNPTIGLYVDSVGMSCVAYNATSTNTYASGSNNVAAWRIRDPAASTFAFNVDVAAYGTAGNPITWVTTFQSSTTGINAYVPLTLQPYGSSAGQGGKLLLAELFANGSNVTGFQAPDALASDAVYTMPTGFPGSNMVLQSTSAGVLSWVSAVTASNQNAHLAYVGPASGSAALPTFRQLTYADVATAAKLACRVASTVNISNLSAPGSTIDGVSMVAGDRVLLKNQTTGSQNGIWIWNGAAVAMTRPEDYAASNTIEAFADMEVAVRSGTTNAGTCWRMTTTGAITIDTTSTAWSQVAYSVGSGSITGVLPVANGGTGLSTVAASLAFVGPASGSNAAPTWRQLTYNDVATVTKLPCRVASAGVNVNTASAPSTIDGVTLASGDRVLLKDQGTASQNGLWVFNGAGSAMTRPIGFSSGGTLEAFYDLQVDIREGTTNAGTVWRITTTGTITVDTTSITWGQVTYSVGSGAVTGTLPIANGGTGSTSYATNGVVTYNGSTFAASTGFTFNTGSLALAGPNTASGTATSGFTFTGSTMGGLGGLTASTEYVDIDFNLGHNVNFATGAIGNQRAFVVRLPTYSFQAASTITNAATVAITGAPAAGTNATITNAYALWVQGGNVLFAGQLAVTGGVNSLQINDSAGTRSIVTIGAQGANTGFELGRTDGTASSSFIDFHSSAASVDYNARILVNGDKAIGAGDMAFTAGTYFFTGTAITTAGVTTGFTFQAGAHTNITASTENVDTYFNLARNITWAASGTVAQNRSFLVAAPTLASATATTTTVTKAATFAITGAPNNGSNLNITNAYALWVQAGATQLDGGAVILAGLTTGGNVAMSQSTGTGNHVTITQAAQSSGSPTGLTFTGAAHTTLTASTEAIDVNFNLARTVSFAQGAIATQRAFVVQAPTYAFPGGASTVTNAATFAITGAPAPGSNATLTNTWAFWVQAGKVKIADTSLGSTATTGAVQIGDGTTANSCSIGGGYVWAGQAFITPGTSLTTPSFDLNNAGAGRVSLGSILDVSALSFSTSYIGFNFARTATNTWGRAGDGSNNGGSAIWGTISGALVFATIASTGTGSTTNSDAQALSAAALILQPTTTQFFQQAATTGSPTGWSYTPGAHTTLTSGTETFDVQYVLNRTVQWATTVPTTQRAFVIAAPTYACNTASQTITTAATFAIGGAPAAGANVTITNSYALWVQAGNVLLAGTTSASSATAGAFVVGNGTAATSVAVGAGLINVGGGATLAGVSPLTINQTAGSGSPVGIKFVGAAHTALTAFLDYNDVFFNLARTVTINGGSYTSQRAVYITAPTYAYSSATTVTHASTFAISGAPTAGTNATLTNTWAMRVELGASHFAWTAVASSATTGTVVVGNLTAATSVGIGAGQVWAGGGIFCDGPIAGAQLGVAQAFVIPQWYKFTVTFSTFSTAATTNSPVLFTLPAACIIHAVKIKHSASFTGGTITAYTISVGITGTLAKYAAAFNVFQATGNTVESLTGTLGTENHGAGTSILATATSTGGNLNTATAGSCDIWVLISKAI